MKKFLVPAGALALSGSSLMAEVPASITGAITDVTTAGASVFTAVLAIGLPFLLWRLVKKVRG